MKSEEKKSFGIFRKNSDLQAVSTISVLFIVAVLGFQVVNSLLN